MKEVIISELGKLVGLKLQYAGRASNDFIIEKKTVHILLLLEMELKKYELQHCEEMHLNYRVHYWNTVMFFLMEVTEEFSSISNHNI
jgi:hypothetical protein